MSLLCSYTHAMFVYDGVYVFWDGSHDPFSHSQETVGQPGFLLLVIGSSLFKIYPMTHTERRGEYTDQTFRFHLHACAHIHKGGANVHEDISHEIALWNTEGKACVCVSCHTNPRLQMHYIKFTTFLQHFPCDRGHNEAFIPQAREWDCDVTLLGLSTGCRCLSLSSCLTIWLFWK